MVTAVRAETQQTKTVRRPWLLLVQVRNLLSLTTDIGDSTLEKIDRGIKNQWIETVGVYGFDGRDRCRVGLELTINWKTYSVQVELFGETVSVQKAVFREDYLARAVQTGIAVFNQAVIEECLRTDWRVVYLEELDRQRINRDLGFKPSSPLTLAGDIRKQTFPVAGFPELTVTFFEAVPEPETDEEWVSIPIFSRLKQTSACGSGISGVPWSCSTSASSSDC